MNSIDHIVDTDRYPVSAPQSPAYDALITHCKEKLARNGLCLLAGFIRDDALQQMQSEANALAPHAHHTEHWRATPNGAPDDPHSKLATSTRAAMGSIGYDRLQKDSPLRSLYQSTHLTQFLNTLFDGEPLYPTDDPLVSCMLTVLNTGDELGWHYDPNDLVVSLALQQADNGGEFEFAPRIRAPADDAANNETAVLAGHYPATISESLSAGTLSFFNGHRSLHRVAPVGTGTPRVIALFNYSEQPHYRFSSTIQQQFFGRSA